MARKKNVSNQAAGREETVNYDIKRLKQMSAKEIMDYYDREEPLSDDEVNAIYNRVMPRIAYEIVSDKLQKKPRHIGSSIKKTVLVAICITLMLSVVAQALGIPVWKTIVSWTKEIMLVDISYSGNTDETARNHSFSQDERLTWGDDVCNAFEEIGYCPSLPTFMPSNLSLDELLYFSEEEGVAYISALYSDSEGTTLKLVAEALPDDGFVNQIGNERDDSYTAIYEINGTTFYALSNFDRNSVSWYVNNMSIKITSIVDPETLKAMILSIPIYSEEN